MSRHDEAVRTERRAEAIAREENSIPWESSALRCNKSRPTHFICIPFSSPEIKLAVEAVQRSLCDLDERLKPAMLPLGSLHVTLIMMRCPCADTIAKAKTVFNDFAPFLNIFVPRACAITFQGLSDFRERVVYASPSEVGRLCGLVEAMFKARFV